MGAVKRRRAMEKHQTPMLDQLEGGEWPSFITGIKRLRDLHPDQRIRETTNDLLGQLEHSYETRKGYWKGGTVSVFGYGGGIIPRFSEVGEQFPKSREFHTLRVQPPAGNYYTTDILRRMADSWEKWGSGLVTFHGQTGNIMFIGATTENTQKFFDEINDYGFDLGGAGPCVRTAQSCVGSGRCEQSCANEHEIHRRLVNNFIDEMHRPALPYKFKDEVKKYVGTKGRKYLIDNVITRCPTHALSLEDDDTLSVDNPNCVRCMHCLNVMPKALSPGQDRGISLLIGGKRTLKIGDRFGTVIIPFMKMESEEDYERLVEIAEETVDFFAENALEHERIGEMIERIGLVNFLDALGIDVDPNMIVSPRESSYVRTDTWEEEAAKWYERHPRKQSVDVA
ncbi:MAG: sulfite reductase, dissimilatory-type subunit alpha [Candidatus Thiodiazotropha sp.]